VEAVSMYLLLTLSCVCADSMKKMVMPSENQYTGDDFQQSGKEDLLPVPKARREIQNNYF